MLFFLMFYHFQTCKVKNVKVMGWGEIKALLQVRPTLGNWKGR